MVICYQKKQRSFVLPTIGVIGFIIPFLGLAAAILLPEKSDEPMALGNYKPGQAINDTQRWAKIAVLVWVLAWVGYYGVFTKTLMEYNTNFYANPASTVPASKSPVVFHNPSSFSPSTFADPYLPPPSDEALEKAAANAQKEKAIASATGDAVCANNGNYNGTAENCETIAGYIAQVKKDQGRVDFMHPEGFLPEYEADPLKAEATYDGKSMLVKATVHHKTQQGDVILYLQAAPGATMIAKAYLAPLQLVNGLNAVGVGNQIINAGQRISYLPSEVRLLCYGLTHDNEGPILNSCMLLD